jgi:hypothetical protein
MEIDLHGYYPYDVNLTAIVQQVWEMGCPKLWIIHGHGRNRVRSPGFVNTNTGFLGLWIRNGLRNDPTLRQWIKYTTLDCSDMGVTSIKLKPNPAPTRTHFDSEAIGWKRYAKVINE